MTQQTLNWIGFNVLVAILLILDLFVFNRKHRAMKMREALGWTGLWLGLAALFNVFLYFYMGKTPALQFLTGYLIEESLSIDNLFVFLMLFTFFRTPTAFQHKVLFWGILGAIFFRGLFILIGFTAIQKFPIITYGLGAFLIFTAIRMFTNQDQNVNPDNSPVTKLLGKIMPITPFYDGSKFFTRENGKKLATPLFVALLVVETTDIVFAFDSIPAVLAVTPDAFIAYSSNIFAILGLRALYFALAGIMKLFHYLHYGLSLILLFIGLKLVLANWLHIGNGVSLSVVGGILLFSVVLSLIFKKKEELPKHNTHGKQGHKPAKPF
jgi:tellurite resistance protein TerC